MEHYRRKVEEMPFPDSALTSLEGGRTQILPHAGIDKLRT